MSSSPAVRKARPLSPHLQVYRPQLTSVMSIFHRMTGVGLALGLVVLVLWLVALAGGASAYQHFLDYAHSTLGQIVLFGWVWAFFYHLCTGIRHVIWDVGHMLEIKQVYKTGALAVVLSTLLTFGFWFSILWSHP